MPVKESELNPETRKKLGIKNGRRRGMSKDDVRGHAIRVLSVVAQLTQSDRERVLRHAVALNAV